MWSPPAPGESPTGPRGPRAAVAAVCSCASGLPMRWRIHENDCKMHENTKMFLLLCGIKKYIHGDRTTAPGRPQGPSGVNKA